MKHVVRIFQDLPASTVILHHPRSRVVMEGFVHAHQNVRVYVACTTRKHLHIDARQAHSWTIGVGTLSSILNCIFIAENIVRICACASRVRDYNGTTLPHCEINSTLCLHVTSSFFTSLLAKSAALCTCTAVTFFARFPLQPKFDAFVPSFDKTPIRTAL